MATFKGFTETLLKRPPRSTFDLSHEKRVSTRIGRLTPILCVETLPGDTFHGSSEALIKLAPLQAPIFHRLNMYVHYFFVPNRLLWEDWEDFITGGRLGAEVTNPPQPPYFLINEVQAIGSDFLDQSTWADYLGLRPIADGTAGWAGRGLDIMPWAALTKVWYDYYRDRNYLADVDYFPLQSGHQADMTLVGYMLNTRNRCWEHDYFTSALPFTQRGTEVLMPIAGTGSVTYLPTSFGVKNGGGAPAGGDINLGAAAGPGRYVASSTNEQIHIENIDEVTIENSEISMNDFRRANALQKWMERNALAGSRYNESIMAHYGVRTSDARLQRAEYLGGGKAVIQISEVMTTAFSQDGDSNTVPPANMAGRGSVYGNTNRFKYFCEEHGFIVGFLSIMPTSGYMDGNPRMFHARRTQLDYPFPVFAHLGEQPVYDYEVYADNTSIPAYPAAEPPVFGYQSRYSDWKYIPSSCHGDFRTSLDFWHLTRKFSAQPDLGADFVEFESDLQDRIFAVADTDTCWLYLYNKLKVNRALPYYGTPQIEA